MILRNPLIAMSVLACSVAIAGPALSKAVVVRSAGPSAKTYPPGRALPDSATISLKPGDSVTVLGPNSTKTLRGPGSFPASSADAEGLAMAAARRTRFGAMRTGELSLNPSPWNLDISQSGTICIAQGSTLKIWRASAKEAAKLDITVAGKTMTLDWPASNSTVDWPSSLPISEGIDYQFVLAGGASPETVRFVMIPTIPPNAVDAAKSLIENGCQNQLDVLIDSLEQAE